MNSWLIINTGVINKIVDNSNGAILKLKFFFNLGTMKWVRHS